MTPEEFRAAAEALVARRDHEGDVRAAVLAYDVARRMEARIQAVERALVGVYRPQRRAA